MPPVVVRNDELTWKDICCLLYEEGAFDNIVISPGPGSPTCPADIGKTVRSRIQLTLQVEGIENQALSYYDQ